MLTLAFAWNMGVVLSKKNVQNILIKICTKFYASFTIWTIFLLTSSLATEIEFFLIAILTKNIC